MKGRAERAGSGQTRARGRVVTTRIAPPVTTAERPNVPTPAAAHVVPDCVPIGTRPEERGKDALDVPGLIFPGVYYLLRQI